jgi:hypothetical protein
MPPRRAVKSESGPRYAESGEGSAWGGPTNAWGGPRFTSGGRRSGGRLSEPSHTRSARGHSGATSQRGTPEARVGRLFAHRERPNEKPERLDVKVERRTFVAKRPFIRGAAPDVARAALDSHGRRRHARVERPYRVRTAATHVRGEAPRTRQASPRARRAALVERREAPVETREAPRRPREAPRRRGEDSPEIPRALRTRAAARGTAQGARP